MSAAQQIKETVATASLGFLPSAPDPDLLLRETNHRCSNDLQLVVSLLGLQSRRAAIPEVRQALADAMERVSIIARARNAMHREHQPSLEAALQQVCDALRVYGEPRAIQILFEADRAVPGLAESRITVLALVVNELMTNAIKHAFEEGKTGDIRVSLGRDAGNVIVIVDDDGLPFPEATSAGGLGMGLVKRLMASIGGVLVMPPSGSKVFELRVPVGTGGS